MEIKLNNSEGRRKREWEGIQADLFRLRARLLKIDQFQINGGRLIKEFTQIMIIFWSAKAVLAGDISLGTMLAIQFIVGSLSVPISNSINFLVGLQRATLSLNRLSEIHSQPDEEKAYTRTVHFPSGNLQLRDINFKYGELGAGYVLKKLSACIPQGKITAIVGMSGSGKTTLMKLLLKLYYPETGKINIGEEDFADIDGHTWRKNCGAVLQDGIIFDDTIERNITESKSDFPTDRKLMIEAVRMANLQEMLESLPLGYQTRIGEQGHLLSGGEKQRLLIARAIYKNPKYLFFDEASSSLDAENERMISANLSCFFKNRTVIIVAHRLSTIRHADQILVMNSGSIAERGTHQELILKNGIYHNLIKNQL